MNSFYLIAASAVLTTSRGRRFAFSRKSLRCRRAGSSSQQSHVAFVCEQLVGQLHVQRLTFNFLHLGIDGSGAELHLRFCSRRSPVDLVAHLVERGCVVAKLERLHRLSKLFLKFCLLRLVNQLHRLSSAALHLKHVIIARFKCLLRCGASVLQLLGRFLQIELRLLQLTDVSGRDVVAPHLHRSAYFGVEIDYLRLEPLFVFGEKFLSGHDLRHRVVQFRHAVAHVADSLLKNELGIFSLLDNPTEKGAHGALHSCPKSHSRSSSDSDVKSKNVIQLRFTPIPGPYDDFMYVTYV